MVIKKDTLGQLLAGRDPRSVFAKDGLVDELKKALANRVLSAELDEKLAIAAQEIFTDDTQVEVLAADWSTLRDKGPYSLLFLDPSSPEDASVDSVADLVEPGGIVVMDDFTPCEMWPPITMGRVDTLRESWLTDPRFTAVEVMVAPDASALIATKN